MFGKATIIAVIAATAQIVAGQNATVTSAPSYGSSSTTSDSYSVYSSYPIYRTGSCFTTSAVNGSSPSSYTTGSATSPAFTGAASIPRVMEGAGLAALGLVGAALAL